MKNILKIIIQTSLVFSSFSFCQTAMSNDFTDNKLMINAEENQKNIVYLKKSDIDIIIESFIDIYDLRYSLRDVDLNNWTDTEKAKNNKNRKTKSLKVETFLKKNSLRTKGNQNSENTEGTTLYILNKKETKYFISQINNVLEELLETVRNEINIFENFKSLKDEIDFKSDNDYFSHQLKSIKTGSKQEISALDLQVERKRLGIKKRMIGERIRYYKKFIRLSETMERITARYYQILNILSFNTDRYNIVNDPDLSLDDQSISTKNTDNRFLELNPDYESINKRYIYDLFLEKTGDKNNELQTSIEQNIRKFYIISMKLHVEYTKKYHAFARQISIKMLGFLNDTKHYTDLIEQAAKEKNKLNDFLKREALNNGEGYKLSENMKLAKKERELAYDLAKQLLFLRSRFFINISIISNKNITGELYAQNNFRLEHSINESIIRIYDNYKNTNQGPDYLREPLQSAEDFLYSRSQITVHDIKRQEIKMNNSLFHSNNNLIFPNASLNASIVNFYKRIFKHQNIIKEFCNKEEIIVKKGNSNLCNHINDTNLEVEKESKIQDIVFLQQQIEFSEKIEDKINSKENDFKTNFDFYAHQYNYVTSLHQLSLFKNSYKNHDAEGYKNYMKNYVSNNIIKYNNQNPFRSETLDIEDYEYDAFNFTKDNPETLHANENNLKILKDMYVPYTIKHHFTFTHTLRSLIKESRSVEKEMFVGPGDPSYEVYYNRST